MRPRLSENIVLAVCAVTTLVLLVIVVVRP